jgi:GTP-binding protein EngB required for normal cell division
MKNILEKILTLVVIIVLVFTIISSRNNISERDITISNLLEENRTLVLEINQKTDSLEIIQVKYLKKQDSLKNDYDERINKNKKDYMDKVSSIRTLSIDDGIELLTKFLSEENSLE